MYEKGEDNESFAFITFFESRVNMSKPWRYAVVKNVLVNQQPHAFCSIMGGETYFLNLLAAGRLNITLLFNKSA